MNRWRLDAGILSVAAGCQAATRGGEPLLVHEARLPGFHANRWSRAGGDEPLARELSRILHRGCPLTGVSDACWSVHGHMGGVSILFPGPPLGPWKLSMEPAMAKVSFVASVHVTVGAVRRMGTFSWVAAFSWPVRASFGSGELRSLGRSWALHRGGGEESG